MPFVTFEGIDGSGKSTQAKFLADYLINLGKQVVATREPWGGRLGKAVRALLTDAELARALSPAEEMLLIAASRYDHVRSVIRPGLTNGGWVVCDRFIDATYAYQIYGLLDEELAAALSNFVCGDLVPDVTFVLDVEPALAERRLSLRQEGSVDPAESRRDFSRIRQGFCNVISQNPRRCHMLDGSQAENALSAEIIEILRTLRLLH